MTQFNSYPHFVADQVLTADNLNSLFDFLDEQNRLTRNKLLGIGIACGLDVTPGASDIKISKGTGITSAGYLIVFDGETYTHYKNTDYQFPTDFDEIISDYGYNYKNWQARELVKASDAKAGDQVIASNAAFLSDKVVVLLLEKKSEDLKNCTNNDCDDKGENVSLTARPLLVSKTSLTATGVNSTATLSGFPTPSLKRLFIDLDTGKTSAQLVLKSFVKVLNDTKVLQDIENGGSKIYQYFGPLFPDSVSSNPFTGFAALFADKTEKIILKNPLFTQYCYDWLDDLVKAYNEFYLAANDIVSECCPSESLFPMHLMLGEANKNSATDIVQYRNYFIYSALFDPQSAHRRRLRSLINRLLLMMKDFAARDFKEMLRDETIITPSRWSNAALSKRCIPYYYKPKPLFQYWNYDLSWLGKADRNLSYNADAWATADPILNPLEYDIEKNDFYRIEGHIGKPVTQAYKEIMNLRSAFNLGFDVVGINMGIAQTNLDFVEESQLYCSFKDLESAYNVSIVGLLENLHKSVCFFSRLPFYDIFRATFEKAVGNEIANSGTFTESFKLNQVNENTNTNILSFAMANTSMAKSTACFAHSNLRNDYATWVDGKQTDGYTAGDLIKDIFTPQTNTVGEYFLAQLASGTAFSQPTDNFGTNMLENLMALYERALYFLQLVDDMMVAVFDSPDLAGLDYKSLKKAINNFEKYVRVLNNELMLILAVQAATADPTNTTNNEFRSYVIALSFDQLADELEMLLDMGFEEQVQALYYELLKRKKKILEEFSLDSYGKSHPGFEHKAGVPRGGTFILLYSLPDTGKSRFVMGQNALELVKAEKALVMTEKAAPQMMKMDMMEGAPVAMEAAPQDVSFTEEITDVENNPRSYYKKYPYNNLGEITEDRKLLTYIQTRGLVFADLYLPYQCCGGCGSPAVWVPPAEPEPQPEKVTLTRSTTWQQNIDLKAVVSSVSSDAIYANDFQWTNKDGLVVDNSGQISSPPVAQDTYVMVYETTANGNPVEVTLNLTINIESVGLDITACYPGSTAKLSDIMANDAGGSKYTTILKLISAGTLIIDPSTFVISGLPDKDATYTMEFMASDGTSAFDIKLNLNIKSPNASFKGLYKKNFSANALDVTLTSLNPSTSGLNEWNIFVKDMNGNNLPLDNTRFQSTSDAVSITYFALTIDAVMRIAKESYDGSNVEFNTSGFFFRHRFISSKDPKDPCSSQLDSEFIDEKFFSSVSSVLEKEYKQ